MESTKQTILTLLTEHGYIISQQRLIIIDTLCATPFTGSIDDLWLYIRQEHRISWATVHKTVRLLVKLKCIVPICTKKRQQQFILSN
ncbi:transcriptional repressor [Sphingobacterium pedocola]|uniref:Fur family transcriptional regulator n=1 Tax=Sphingobacterium pedocola TaxID=2082722 RepID=A0ABR9T3N8_9SPHI|nr:transcriptional repressor [Sphingobacterium pedocola]MBE8719970.1 hypothetical protein [Sphingobacterium pedocola]